MNKQEARKARQKRMKFRRNPVPEIQVLNANGEAIRTDLFGKEGTRQDMKALRMMMNNDFIAQNRIIDSNIIHD